MDESTKGVCMIPFLLVALFMSTLSGMESLPQSIQSSHTKTLLLSPQALQNSHILQSWLEECESPLGFSGKISSPQREFTNQLISMVGPAAVSFLNDYHTQNEYGSWYKKQSLTDLLTLCAALQYVDSPLHERDLLIDALGERTLKDYGTTHCSSAQEKSALFLAALKHLGIHTTYQNFNKSLSEKALEVTREQLHSEFLTVSQSCAFFFSARNGLIFTVPLLNGIPPKSIAAPFNETVTALDIGCDGTLFTGTKTGKLFDMSTSSPRFIAQSRTQEPIKKISAPSRTLLLAHTDRSIIWKVGESLFEHKYTESITDCAFRAPSHLMVLLSAGKKMKLATLTTYGKELAEEILPFSYARLCSTGKKLIGIGSKLSSGGFFVYHLDLSDGARESFFISDTHDTSAYADTASNNAILPWNGTIAGLPALDIGLSTKGNFFFVKYGLGKTRIINVQSGSYHELMQNHTPVIALYETEETLNIVRPTPTNLSTITYDLRRKINCPQTIDHCLLAAAIHYAYKTKGGLALSASNQPELYALFLTLSQEKQDFYREQFCVQAAGV
jgi:hypothetical protein